MTIKNELLITVANWIEQSDTERDGTFSCGLPTLEKDFSKEYCLLITVANWIEQSDTERDGTFSCGLPTLEKDFSKEYCTPNLECDSCPFWINPEMEKLCDTLLEYSK